MRKILVVDQTAVREKVIPYARFALDIPIFFILQTFDEFVPECQIMLVSWLRVF
ncbi:MAG: hypothetical protein QNJ58_15440 [Desulfobacterales bacterium]|nr:hypothetical protein [Desulfobacterales bacterium]